MDWRGQGGSERQLRDPRKGHIDDFALYERDFVAFQRDVLRRIARAPGSASAHSMGGAIALRIAHEGRCPFDRLVHDGADDRALRPCRAALSRAGSPRRSTASASAAPMRRAAARRPYTLQPFEGNVLTSDPHALRAHGRDAARLSGIVRRRPHHRLGCMPRSG